MCTPALAAGMALSAAGSAVNRIQQNQNASRSFRAGQKAVRKGAEAQNGYRTQAQGVLSNAIDQQSAPVQFGDLMSLRAANGQRVADAVSAPTTGSVPTPSGAPAVVQNEADRKIAQAVAGAKQRATNLGALGAWGLNRSAAGRGLAQSGEDLGIISNKAAGTANLLPLQIQQAQNRAIKPAAPFGDLMKLGGQGLSLYGMFGTGPGTQPFGDLFGPEAYTPGTVNPITGMYGHI